LISCNIDVAGSLPKSPQHDAEQSLQCRGNTECAIMMLLDILSTRLGEILTATLLAERQNTKHH
jgi:hypothetical protein